ncbi:S10 family peptidase [Tanticharoenia sakaeratensis]|uniref:Peptidase S10 serine carboxypeptidase n=1 Tax=Tanticharoenia sakaeratensis NBRC 103193 TaxID=1231623 RepID=A0A0D6MN03_9PROT|nr:peptidase S10 serine carboxypeptidase [Tanticharoenia sakaeratensis NBRC 103193]
MKHRRNPWGASALSLALSTSVLAAPTTSPDKPATTESTSSGTVTMRGQAIAYTAVAGTLVVHPNSYDDSTDIVRKRVGEPDPTKPEDKTLEPTASMFYTAYFKKGADPATRPITFVYNGGPGSASVWLHMGSFGPRRIETLDDSHTPAAPYRFINNDDTLLDASDVVFIDAPGTGFGRIAGKDAEKAFWGVDADGHAFANFITQFLGKFGRYNSPKYLFGESYGTMRSAVVVNDLQNDDSIDFNGVILLSQILSYGNSVDGANDDPGNDRPYVLALPTYAATAAYHHMLPTQPADLQAFLREVEHFASTDYLLALQQGADLSAADRQHVVQKLHDYTGLPVDYIDRADLRITGGEFEHELQARTGIATGRLDTRFSGPQIDPMSKEVGYDPQSSAISSAYVSAFNDYVRKTLHYGDDAIYRPFGRLKADSWQAPHTLPDDGNQSQVPNVMPDLALAMKTNPLLHVMLNAGYFDLATPYYEGIYEMKHLPIPAALQKNIEFKQYQSGHMVYVSEASLKQLHDNVAAFIRETDHQG